MAKSVVSQILNRTVKDQEIWNFEVQENGVYVIAIRAKCKNWLQNMRHLFSDDDLAIQIDTYIFAEIAGKKREFTNPGSWNGNELKNTSKQILFILPLKSGSHAITFWVGTNPFLEEIDIYKFQNNQMDLVDSGIIHSQNFLDLIVKNITVQDLKVSAKTDTGSSLGIKIDGQVQANSQYKKYKKWYWYGGELKGDSKDYQIPDNLDTGIHSLEFRGEGKPNIKSIDIHIDVESIEYVIGHIALRQDIQEAVVAHVRSIPSDKGDVLTNVEDGEKIGIHTERVVGEYLTGLSEIWHEVTYQGIKGFTLSSFVEIEGQERGKMIDLIKDACQKYDVDPNLMLAIAARESHFKPYAKSPSGPKGIFQLTQDTSKDMKVTDQYDFYQNIDGGVQYYKYIEKQITGRGDILIKRLAAWYDGPTKTNRDINQKKFSYDNLSSDTKGFIKNVQANLANKDWYHILSLLFFLFLLISGGFVGVDLFNPKYDGSNFAQVVASNNALSSHTVDVLKVGTHFSAQNLDTHTSTSSAMLDFRRQDSTEYTSYFPNVFLNDTHNQVVFLNSQKEIIATIPVASLRIDESMNVPEGLKKSDWSHAPEISSVILENPHNVFYFSATNSYNCGASNCNWILYRFDARDAKLDVLGTGPFGEVTGLYLSPNLGKIAWTASDSGGNCLGGSGAGIINLLDFKKYIVSDPLAVQFSYSSITEALWENNHVIKFTIQYQHGDDCLHSRLTEVEWLYDTADTTFTALKSDTVQLPQP